MSKMENIGLSTKNTIELKNKVMLQKIDKLSLLYNMLFYGSCNGESKAIQVIKQQYTQMYNKIVEMEEYEQYKQVEDIVLKEIAKVELNMEQYIYHTAKNCRYILERCIKNIFQSENYQNFQHVEKELKSIEIIKELFKLYAPYIGEDTLQEVQKEIAKVKFDLLYRKQVEELIYENGGKKSNLLQYDSELEKDIFKKKLQEKIKYLEPSFKEDKLFEQPIDEIMKKSKLLERLILMDIRENVHSYKTLAKAKIFNAHLCNIGNNPFKRETYTTEKDWEEFGYMKGFDFNEIGNKEEKYNQLKADKANYSLLVAILENIITDENISFSECEQLYRRFGFKCEPILVNIGQACVRMILERTGEIPESDKEQKQRNKDFSEKYCKFEFTMLDYKFEENNRNVEDIWKEILCQRNVEVGSEKENEITTKKDFLQERKEKVKKEGIVTTDIDIILLLIEDLLQEFEDFIKWEKNEYEELYDNMQYLRVLKNRTEKLGLKQYKEILFIINKVYEESYVYCNPRKILPLGCMGRAGNHQEFLAPIPKKYYGGKSISDIYVKTTVKPLWEKYQRDFKELGIKVKSCCVPNFGKKEQCFPIAVCLGDIIDLPIDYEKVDLLTKEELQKIEEKEGKEKE